MSLCAFVLIASEFMPVSLLTPIAADLRVSEGQAGWGIGISGIFAVITSLLIPQLTGQRDRRSLLLVFTAIMGASGAIVGFAPNYTVYMIGRALIGVVVGGFWSMSVAVAMRLVPLEKIPRAMAIFNGGNALATVLAAPLGSYLGGLVGWRGVFFSLVPLAAATILWQRLALPPLPAQNAPRETGANASANADANARHTAHSSRSRTAAAEKAERSVLTLFLSQRVVTLGMLAVGLFFMGQFTLYTYVRPFLENATQVTEASTLSLILLAIGVAGLVGNALIGGALRRSLYGVLIAVPILMAVLAGGLLSLGHVLPVAVTLLALWGLIGTAAPVGWWSWLAQTLPKNAETGGALMVAMIQLSIGLGSFVGGLLFDGPGYRATFATSATLLLTAATLANLTRRHR
ncbi:transcriptional regulator [Cephaloticoccus primus]|uniref:Transcriptional regulator n=1 Tax=Cephaloticoccus primus TaxID=1548207 RepID=A0A139SRB0_9BACT|nr:transcriptional regulator [Cephaloticoccus primus]